jgi:hypothetical protein
MINFGVREVANSKSVAAPGWAYVPDTGVNASVAALQPSSRKRARNQPVASQHETTAKQDARILRELAALDRENHRDVSIPVPIKHRDNAGRGEPFRPFHLFLHLHSSTMMLTPVVYSKSWQSHSRRPQDPPIPKDVRKPPLRLRGFPCPRTLCPGILPASFLSAAYAPNTSNPSFSSSASHKQRHTVS